MYIKSVIAGAIASVGIAAAALAADVKVGFVYVGPVGDYGWTYEHDQGRLAVEEHFGNRVETCLLYTSPSPRDATLSRMPSSA